MNASAPRRVARTTIAALAGALVALVAVVAAEDLPELGDGSTLILSPTDEDAIGRNFLRLLICHPGSVDGLDKDGRELIDDQPCFAGNVTDAELLAYLNRLGAAIASHADLRETRISIHLVNQAGLNAFTVPGGHITYNTGLLLAADNEGELAAVMAHEIAHISQRHLPRLLAKMEGGKLPAAAAILAALVVGGQQGLAGLAAANALLLSNQLAYTRGFEREADAIGIKLLAESGYDPNAMVEFFEKLERAGGYGDELPEFLRTHPLSFARMAAAEDRAAQFADVVHTHSSRDFFFARAKIRALFAPRGIDNSPAYFESRIAETEGDERDAAIYALALVQGAKRQYDRARMTLAPLLAAHPTQLALQIARAEIDLAAGNPGAAAARYAELVEANPQAAYLTYYQAEALLANRDAQTAKRVIRRQLRRHKEMFTLYPLLSKSNSRLGDPAESYQASAEFHAALGEYDKAVATLKQALRASDEDGYLYESISARLKGIEEIIEQKQKQLTQ